MGTINIFFSKDLYRVIEEILSKQSVNYNIGVSIGMIISTSIILVVSVFVVNIISKNALKKSSSSNKLNRLVKGGAAGAGIMALFIIIAKFGNQVVFFANIFLVISLLIGFFVAHKLLSRI